VSPANAFARGLADEVRYSILPILIGDGIPFFEKLDRDVALHLAEVKAYKSGIVDLRYECERVGEGDPFGRPARFLVVRSCP
jgi:dihydrofolate reductase